MYSNRDEFTEPYVASLRCALLRLAASIRGSLDSPSVTGDRRPLPSTLPLNSRRCSDWLNGVQADVLLRSSRMSRVKLWTLASRLSRWCRAIASGVIGSFGLPNS